MRSVFLSHCRELSVIMFFLNAVLSQDVISHMVPYGVIVMYCAGEELE